MCVCVCVCVFACVWSVNTEDKLYIIMELVEGATLGEHFASLKEKRQKFSESRIWNIFFQVSRPSPYFHDHTAVALVRLRCK